MVLPDKFSQFNCDNASSMEPPPLMLLTLELPMNGMCGNRFDAKSMRSSAIEFCKKFFGKSIRMFPLRSTSMRRLRLTAPKPLTDDSTLSSAYKCRKFGKPKATK